MIWPALIWGQGECLVVETNYKSVANHKSVLPALFLPKESWLVQKDNPSSAQGYTLNTSNQVLQPFPPKNMKSVLGACFGHCLHAALNWWSCNGKWQNLNKGWGRVCAKRIESSSPLHLDPSQNSFHWGWLRIPSTGKSKEPVESSQNQWPERFDPNSLPCRDCFLLRFCTLSCYCLFKNIHWVLAMS